jgi:hypothetical protein
VVVIELIDAKLPWPDPRSKHRGRLRADVAASLMLMAGGAILFLDATG